MFLQTFFLSESLSLFFARKPKHFFELLLRVITEHAATNDMLKDSL